MWFLDEFEDKLSSCESCTKRNTCTKEKYHEDCHDLDMEVFKQLREEVFKRFNTFLLFIPLDVTKVIVNFIFLIAFTLLVLLFYL